MTNLNEKLMRNNFVCYELGVVIYASVALYILKFLLRLYEISLSITQKFIN